MKKMLTCVLSIFGFLFLFANKVDAIDYNGKLGYDYSVSSTRFYYLNEKATKVYLNIEGLESIEISKEPVSGIYYYGTSSDVEGDLKDKEYYYHVCYEDNTCIDTIDPFANSIDTDRDRNVILDYNAHSLQGWEDISSVETDYYNNSIYAIEADKFVEKLVISTPEGEEFNDSIFTRLVTNSQYAGINAGYSYLNNLGIKNLEIGNLYDDNNYFSPNQEYSTKLDNYSAIQELKKVILGYKAIKMNVILRTDFLLPGDELRQTLMNVSSDYIVDGRINLNNSIMKRYIKDVYKYWASEYKVDGFYILNANLYGSEYLNELITELKEINKSIFVYTDFNSDGYYTSDSLQQVLFGSLENANNEGIVNGNYSEDNFANLVNYMFSGYYNDLGKYADATKVINNIGNFNGIDIYSKIRIISGLATSENEISNKVKIGLQTIFTSAGIPRLIAGNEFLNTTIVSSSQISTISEDKMICNSTKTLCYAKGNMKTIDWGYLVQNSSSVIRMMIYRNNYQYQYPNYLSMNTNKEINYDKEAAKLGVLYLTINYDADYKGELEKSIMLVNYSNNDVELKAITDRDYSYIDAIIGKVDGDDNTTKVYQYTFFTLSQTKAQKFSDFIYILIVIGLLIFVFGVRALLINLLKTKRGIDYKEYSKEQRIKNKKNKKKNSKREREPSVFTTFMSDDPIVKDVGKKIKKDKENNVERDEANPESNQHANEEQKDEQSEEEKQ